MPIPQFGDFPFDITTGCLIANWNDEVQVREAVAPVPRSNVAKAQPGFLAPRTVKIEGVIVAPDPLTLRARIAAFQSAHGPGFRNLYRSSEQYLIAEVRTMSVVEDNMSPTSAHFSASYQAADPFFHLS